MRIQSLCLHSTIGQRHHPTLPVSRASRSGWLGHNAVVQFLPVSLGLTGHVAKAFAFWRRSRSGEILSACMSVDVDIGEDMGADLGFSAVKPCPESTQGTKKMLSNR